MTDSMQVVWIEDADKKADCTKKILEKLPEWFGNEQALYDMAEKYFVCQGCKYVIVKTLSDIVDFEPYARTRKFYKSVGFEPLITLTEMWDEENPCLIMVKQLV